MKKTEMDENEVKTSTPYVHLAKIVQILKFQQLLEPT